MSRFGLSFVNISLGYIGNDVARTRATIRESPSDGSSVSLRNICQGNEMIAQSIRVSKGKHNLTTGARWAVVGRNKQPDEGTGRQIWKCHDPLNCVTPAAF